MSSISLALETNEYPLTIVDGTNLQITLNGAQGPAGASSAPAGTTGSVQINTSGAFSADSGLVYTGTGNSGTLKIGGGSVIVSDPTNSQNVAIGGGNPTLPFTNVVIGSSPDTGKYNTAIGTNTLPALTTGTRNVAIGTSVLSSATTGSNNLAIGVNALANLTTGTGNTAIGTGAANNVTTGSDIICINGSPASATNISSIAIGSNGDGSSTTVIGWAGNTPCTQTRLIGNTLILGSAGTPAERTSIVQNASGSGKTLTLPNATGTVALTSGPQTFTDTQTFNNAVIFGSTTSRPTSAGTGTPNATDLITRGDGDARFGAIALTSALASDGPSVSNSIALVDSGITLTLPAGTYELSGLLYVNGQAKASLILDSATGVSCALVSHMGATSGGSTLTYMTQGATSSFSLGNSALTTGLSFRLSGRIVLTETRTLKIQYAQNSSSAFPAIGKKESFLTATPR